MEVVSDANQDGWWRDCDGQENCDLCSWTYANIYQSSDGSHYNVQFGENKFLIQANWVYRPGTATSVGTSGCVVDAAGTVVHFEHIKTLLLNHF